MKLFVILCPDKVVWHGAHQRGFSSANGEEDDRIMSFHVLETLLKSEWVFAREGRSADHRCR